MAITNALINVGLSRHLGVCGLLLGLMGKGIVSSVKVRKCYCVCYRVNVPVVRVLVHVLASHVSAFMYGYVYVYV